MADAQTTGGYPVLGVVIGADLPLAAQLLPGDALRLAPATLADASAARLAHSDALAAGAELTEHDGEHLALLAGAWPG
jgi:allophanate hydrolase subunit 2